MSHETLVIGVDGFLGGAFYDLAKNTGKEVLGTSFGVNSEMAKRLGIVSHDLTNEEGTVKLICNGMPDIIADFAGIAAPSEVRKNPQLAWKLNVGGVENIMRGVMAAKLLDYSYDPVILIAGSVEEFGESDSVITEESPFAPANLYAEQKLEAGTRSLKLAKEHNLNLYWIHQTNAIGAPDRNDSQNPVHLRHGQNSGFFVTDIAKQIATLEKSGVRTGEIITGHISHQRNLIYNEDAVRVYLALAEKKPVSGRYIVAADKSVSLNDVLKTLTGLSFIEIVHTVEESRGALGKDRFYSNKKIKNATGWTPTTTLSKALHLALEDQRQKIG